MPITPPIDTNPPEASGANAGKRVDILEPPAKPIPESKALPPIDNRLSEQKEEVYKGAFEIPGAVPEPDDPSKYAREFEEDVEDYLVKFERACSNMSRALTECQDTIDVIKKTYRIKLHPNEYKQMCEYMVDFCPAALEIMSSIADYGRGLASRYSKKYPDYWKNPKYEKLLIRGYTAQSRMLEILSPKLHLPKSNASSGYVKRAYDELNIIMMRIEGLKSMAPTSAGNFYLSTTESNIKSIMSKIRESFTLLGDTIQMYQSRTSGLDKYLTPLTIPEVKYTKAEARRDLEKDAVVDKTPNQKVVEELEAIQRALKGVKWYNYRLEPHKRGKQYKIATDTAGLPFIKQKYVGAEKFFQKMADDSNARVASGLKIALVAPLVGKGHFETELISFKFRGNDKKMLAQTKKQYAVVGEIRNFRMMKGDGKKSNDPNNINYKCGLGLFIKPKTFRAKHPPGVSSDRCCCKVAVVVDIYVYPSYKRSIDVHKIYQCSIVFYTKKSIIPLPFDPEPKGNFGIYNLALVDVGGLDVDVMYDAEDFFKADDKHKAEKEEYERDVAEALRDERAGNKSAKSDKVLKDADRMLNNLGYFKDVASSKPKWSEKLEVDLARAKSTPSGIGLGNFNELNLATLLLNHRYIRNKFLNEAFNHIEKVANRYYWYLPKPGEPGYIGDTKESLEKKTKDLLKEIKSKL